MKTKVIVSCLIFSFLFISFQSLAQIAQNTNMSKTQMLSDQNSMNVSGSSSSAPSAVSSSAFLKTEVIMELREVCI